MIELWVLMACATLGEAPGCYIMQRFEHEWQCNTKRDEWGEIDMFDTVDCYAEMPRRDNA